MSIFGSFWKKNSGGSRIKTQPGRWQIGDRIADRYEIYQILGGEGKTGMGVVYICYDHKHKTPYALKTFQEQFLFSEESQKLFEREALVWTELESYPYIVRAEWVDRLEGRLFIVLEYIAPDKQGRNSLTHYLGNLDLPKILKFSIQFCYGMEYAYSKGIDAHRDLKPDNIMITSDKIVKITDFGLAKAFSEIQLKEEIISKEEKPTLSIFKSRGKRICGTLAYMAPEQFDGYADRRSDIYSFGTVLYQMVLNKILPLFIARTPEEYERLHKYALIPSFSSPIFPIISKCVEKDPKKRYQNFGSIREELQNLLLKKTGETITPPERKELVAWELSNKGVALGSLGRYQEEITCYDEAIRINPGHADVWNNKGVALGSLGRYQEAITCFDEAIRINPGHAEAWNNKGVTLGSLGRYQEAITCFDEAIRINPGHADVWNNKGFTLDSLGRYQEAITCFDEAIRINPGYANAWNNKGVALASLGRYQEAITCYDEAIRINPGYANAWNNKGFALARLGRYQEAITCYDEAIRINPGHANAWYNKGVALARLGRYQEEITCYDEAIRINPGLAEAWNNKGVALARLGRYQEAITCYDEAIRINPGLAEAWYNKGVALGNLGRYQKEITCYVEAIRINPGYANAWSNKGVALYSLGRYQEALKCADEAIRLNPTLPQPQQLKRLILEKLRR